MTLILRPYQEECVTQIEAAYAEGARSVVLQAATGFGKTCAASELLRRSVARSRRALFLAHLDSLISDTHARLAAAGVWAGLVQAGRAPSPLAPVHVCSLQTLHARPQERPPADFVILDECHRGPAASVAGILAAYPGALLLGVSATISRGDGRPLGPLFERLVCGPPAKWLMGQGFLVPCDVIAPEAFNDDALAMDPTEAYQRHAPGQRAIVFAANVRHATLLRDRFEQAGYPAACITGETSRTVREAVRARVTAGELRVLIGVGVFIEGFDLPAIECVILARPFTVTGGYLQAIGRGLRPSPVTGKRRCTVLDLRGSVHLHGLPDDDRVWSLDGAPVRLKEALVPLRRCKECLAIFRPAVVCPRCGARAEVHAAAIPRTLTRAQKLEVVSALPPEERDRRYLAQLERVATQKLRLREGAARRWAQKKFRERFSREPHAGACA